MRSILHPGPAAAQRSTVVEAGLAHCALTLRPGRSLLAAVVEALDGAALAQGLAAPVSAVLTLRGGTLFPFAHVLPALSRTPAHAVYFSDRFDADAPVQLELATVTVGLRDGRPWLHCHARWTAADGSPRCGHLLPEQVLLDAPVQAQAWLLDGAAFTVGADAETGFSLFQPVAAPRTGSAPLRPALAVRLAPNQDVCSALEAVCRDRGITAATLRGGVGSTVGAQFDDGRRVEPFVTELLVRQGRVRTGADGAPVAEIDISLVDHLGGLASGRLARGANPVLVTCELVLEPTAWG